MEGVSLQTIASRFGTPTYVYSSSSIKANWHAFKSAFEGVSHEICYAVKANSNLSILNLLATMGAGFDIVSAGELARVLAANGDSKKVIFSGVGKKEEELEIAITSGIYCFNVESTSEISRLSALCERLKKNVNIALRINPNVDAQTHAYISTGLHENKFGIEIDIAKAVCAELKNHPTLKLIGLACHIGSQLTDLTPLMQAIDTLIELYWYVKARGFAIEHLNIGGGLGIAYQTEKPPSILEYTEAVKNKLTMIPVKIIIEPGRSIVGEAGVLLTRVEYLKATSKKNFAVVDAGMNDLLRPALYQAFQTIIPIRCINQEAKFYSIVGPVCESADFIGNDRWLAIAAGEILAIDTVGAYGFSMSSNYNTRPRAAEVLVTDQDFRLIRKREDINYLMSLEKNI